MSTNDVFSASGEHTDADAARGSDEPIFGGVCDLHQVDLDWLDGWLYGRSAIDLGYEEHKKHCEKRDHENCEWSGRILFGKWKHEREYDKTNPRSWRMVWAPDETGVFAAIYNSEEMTTQVAWSRWTQEGRPCSPCYPNQVSLLAEDGYVRAYSLPAEAFDEQRLKEWGGTIDLEVK